MRGPEVFGGYEDDPAANVRAFVDGWFRTGDLGYVDRDGYLFIVGRVKELINRGGFKVSPSAVDVAVMRHPEVVDAATFARAARDARRRRGHGGRGARAGARDGASSCATSRSSISRHSWSRARSCWCRHLPRTPAGKLQRAELAMHAEAAPARGVLAATRPSRRAGGRLVADVLGIDGVGAFDNFFELGGDSLRGAQLVNRLNSELGSNLVVANLFKRPTVAEFAAELAGITADRRQSGLPSIEPRQRSVYRPDSGSTETLT